MLHTGNTPGLLLLFSKIEVYEKECRVTRKRSVMYSAFNVSFKLRQEIRKSGTLDEELKKKLTTALETYQSVAERMLFVNSEIRGKLNDFELQERYVEPVSEQLIDHAGADVDRSLAQIRQVSRWAAWGLGIILSLPTGKPQRRQAPQWKPSENLRARFVTIANRVASTGAVKEPSLKVSAYQKQIVRTRQEGPPVCFIPSKNKKTLKFSSR